MSGSGISWAICKSAPCPRHITMPASHHSDFYRPDALPVAQQQQQSTEEDHNKTFQERKQTICGCKDVKKLITAEKAQWNASFNCLNRASWSLRQCTQAASVITKHDFKSCCFSSVIWTNKVFFKTREKLVICYKNVTKCHSGYSTRNWYYFHPVYICICEQDMLMQIKVYIYCHSLSLKEWMFMLCKHCLLV